jgi:hypothetical protein
VRIITGKWVGRVPVLCVVALVAGTARPDAGISGHARSGMGAGFENAIWIGGRYWL